MSDMETRQQMLEVAARHEEELERAIGDLKQAAHRPFEVSERVRAHITAHPIPWLIGSVLIGLWLGSRNGRANSTEFRSTSGGGGQ